MGLGLLIDAPIRERGWLKRRPRRETIVADLGRELRAAIDDPLLAAHARIVPSDDRLELYLHPATEEIRIRVEDERVVAEARTNPAGPGYHAYVVELLERVGAGAGLDWRWSDEDGDLGDECGYHESRDFGAVQREMCLWLRGLCRLVVEEDLRTMRMCLPMGFEPIGGGVCGPCGPLPWSWIEEVAAAGDDALAVHGAGFFAWWGRTLDAAFWDRYARALAWVDVPWHAAASDEDDRIYAATLAGFARAFALDPGIARPEAELAELRHLSAPDADPTMRPALTGIGYRRGPMRWVLTGGWSMAGQGYWYDDFEDGTIRRWFDDRTVHITTYTASADLDELLSRSRARAAAVAPGDVIRWERDGLHAIGVVERSIDEGYWYLHGEVATAGHLCLATLVYHDDSDRAWAEEAFRSIRR